MKKTLLLAAIFAIAGIKAQTTISTAPHAATGYDGLNYVGPNACVTFAVKNSNSYDIVLTGLEDYKSPTTPFFPLSPGKFILWYSTTSLSGAATITTPDWIKIDDSFTVANLVSGYNTIYSNLAFTIPANTTYRFALQSQTGITYSGGLSPGYASPSTLTADNVSLILGDATIGGQVVGWAGTFPSPSYNTSWFTGSITFRPNIPCTSPPNAGTTTSSVDTVCSGVPFQLGIDNYSNGYSQSYQWQSSLNGTTWANIANDTFSAATARQAVSTYYRCTVTCSGISSYSTQKFVYSRATVSGTYTINSTLATSGTNFSSFADAINYIGCGINGPVVFNVSNGPYDEQVMVPFIGGTTSANTITFNGHGETLLYSGSSTASLAVFTLNDADHIIVDSLVIDGTTSSKCWGFLFTKNADSNIIRKCTIYNNNSSTVQYAYNGIMFNGSPTGTFVSGSNGSYNLITNNKISGGNYGVFVYGGTGFNITGNNTITNNTITDFYNTGIYTSYVKNIKISGNDVSRPVRTNTISNGKGIEAGTGSSNILVEANKVHNLLDAISGSTAHGISVSASAATGEETKVINNLIYSMIGNNTIYGLYNSGNNMLAYHNTIILDDNSIPTAAQSGIQQSGGASGVVYKNNLVSVTTGGTGAHHCLSFASNSTSIVSNKNALYINCPSSSTASLGLFGSLSYTTLADWRQANNNAFDQQSVSADPLFVNATLFNYTPTAAALNNIGENLGVATDINGNTRSGTNPDPGAYEFNVANCINPLTAGIATATITNTCPSNTFGLELTGNSLGAGLTFQWQSSVDSVNWSNTGTQQVISQIVLTQASTNYYRCALQCSGGAIAYSAGVKVVTPSYLSGTYTINNNAPASGTNFQSFTDAINAIKCGVNGPLVFNVVAGSGPYNEHFTISQLTGASATNTLTINGNGATLIHNGDASNKAAIILNGTDHVTINNLKMDVSGTNWGWGVVLMNQADSNTISNCTIIASTTITNGNSGGISLNGSATSLTTAGNNANYNKIINDTIIGGYYSVNLYGGSSATGKNVGNIVSNNVLKDMYTSGVYAQYQSAGLVVSGNDISRPTRTNTSSISGIYIYTGTFGALVEKNKIHDLFDAIKTNTSFCTPIFIGTDPAVGQETQVLNNLIYGLVSNGAINGIVCTQGDNCKMYHNTIVINDQASTATGVCYGLYQPTQSTGIDFRNNLVYLSRSGTGTKACLYIGSSTSDVTSNNNILYLDALTTGNIASLQSNPYATLTAWQAANGSIYDQQSVSTDPLFTNAAAANYKPTASPADNIGAALGVTDDIAGVIRSIGLPDAGAYEFGSILPVSTLNLLIHQYKNSNRLEWTTAFENNNKGFEVLRSYSNKENDFSKIAYLPSNSVNGNSATTTYYFYNDETAAAATTYYRLKQIDKDGKFVYSNTVMVKPVKNNEISIASIYPNPTMGKVNAMISSGIHTTAGLVIADIYGKTVAVKEVLLNVGNNIIELNLSSLAKGVYTIKLTCNNGCETTVEKIIKQ